MMDRQVTAVTSTVRPSGPWLRKPHATAVAKVSSTAITETIPSHSEVPLRYSKALNGVRRRRRRDPDSISRAGVMAA